MNPASAATGRDPQRAWEAGGRSHSRRLSLVLYPDVILRWVCEPVETFDGELCDIADEMLALMSQHQGIGLAAAQVGLRRRLFVSGIGGRWLALANMLVEEGAEPRDFVEGCLSLPGVQVNVRRPERIRVTGRGLWGRRLSIIATGLWARVIQHELDHLNGVLICNHCRPGEGECADAQSGLPAVLAEVRLRMSRLGRWGGSPCCSTGAAECAQPAGNRRT